MNREGVPGKSPEEMYIQQKVRVLLMLRKMGSNVSIKDSLAEMHELLDHLKIHILLMHGALWAICLLENQTFPDCLYHC